MYAEVSGRALDDILGRSVAEVFGAELQDSIGARMDAALRGERISFEHAPPYGDRSRILQYDYIPDVDADGRVQGFYSMVQDITARKEAHRLLRSVADNLPALVSSIDRQGIMRFANRQHEEWFGVPVATIMGAPLAVLLTESEYRKHLQFFEPALEGKRGRWNFERPIRGALRHFQADYIPQVEDGETVGVTLLVNDITHIKQVEQQLSALARFDTLTGLPNRAHLMERIERAIAHSGRSGGQIALMYLDLDNFKSINDSFGHAGGDAVLVEFGRRLSACVRQTDTVGRLAGDEFVILLEGLQSERESGPVAEKIIRAMEKPFNIDGVARIVTTSIGVTSSTGAAAQLAKVDALLKHADDALYRAKQRGRNRYATTAMS
jgi:diguanylate cyclase (GGDEF)-like protein/PAS domain S-box-containing protein